MIAKPLEQREIFDLGNGEVGSLIDYSRKTLKAVKDSGVVGDPFKQSADELKDVSKTLDNLAIGLERDELNEAELSQAIDDIRITLSKVDTRLADSKMIMSGFYGATKQLQEVPEESSEEEVFGAD